MLGLSTDKPDKPNAVLSNILNVKADSKDDKFSLLLKSFSFGINSDADANASINGLENLEKAEKTSSKSSLQKLFNLGQEELPDEDLIHSDIIKALPLKTFKQDLQQLIGEAKAFLKEQISLKTEIKELPKTLGGLIKLAQKSGIDVKAINFESLPATAAKEELSQLLQLSKPAAMSQDILSHSTSQLVKPDASKTDKDAASLKPLNALLNKTAENTSHPKLLLDDASADETAKAGKTPLFNAALNALLHGETTENSGESESVSLIELDKSSDKTQHIAHNKTEQLSQKVAEAKQLIHHVAQSMKESVENYKPPFTRIKMQLNPQKFGDMEVTLVQRGNNVHININANTTALTVMMQNSHELKAQLSAQGLGDASMNFTSHQQQQEQKQKQEHAGLIYEEFQDYEDEFTEMATALEIVVPRYI